MRLGVLERNLAVAVFEQEVELAEDAGYVAAVDFVDDQHVRCVRSGAGLVGDALERSFAELESWLTVLVCRAEAFDEILVGVGRVELDKIGAVFGAGEVAGEFRAT